MHLFKNFVFSGQFWVYSKIEQNVEYMLCPDICIGILVTNKSHKRDTIVTHDESALTIDTAISPVPVDYITVLFQCFTYYGCELM